MSIRHHALVASIVLVALTLLIVGVDKDSPILLLIGIAVCGVALMVIQPWKRDDQ